MTLVEVVIALGIAGLTAVCLISAYVFCVVRAEQSALSYAANARALQRLEETRAAKWDMAGYSVIDEMTNFANQVVTLDLAGAGAGISYATNITRISTISTNPPLRMVQVDCVWRFGGGRLLTNSVATFRAIDQ